MPHSLSSKPVDLRLYTLDGGQLDIHDGSHFFNKDFYPHQSLRLENSIFLIKHNQDWMLWDLGIGDQYAGKSVEEEKYNLTATLSKSLIAQLKEFELTPDDIKYVALSHTHFDHSGNVKLFPNVTWLLQRPEYEFIQREPLNFAVPDDTFKLLSDKPKILLEGDYDIFSDGTVKIISTPGHTPGHQSLQLTLPNHGVIILSGDLCHTWLSYINNQMPCFNEDHEQSLISIECVKDILRKTSGRLIIQHDLMDAQSLPKPPNYLD